MGHGRQDDARSGDEGQSAEQRIESGKKLSGVRLKRTEGSHAGQNHRGVREGVDLGHVFEIAVPEHPDAQTDQDDEGADTNVEGDPGNERPPGQQRSFPMLIHRQPTRVFLQAASRYYLALLFFQNMLPHESNLECIEGQCEIQPFHSLLDIHGPPKCREGNWRN